MVVGICVMLGSPDQIARFYRDLLAEHGDTALGAGWPNEADRIKRFEVMAAIAGDQLKTSSVVDLACGTGEFLGFLLERGCAPRDYVGIDICPDAIRFAKAKFPNHIFSCMDLLADSSKDFDEGADFIVVNGLFTVRLEVSYLEMWRFMEETIRRLSRLARKGIAFNVMSNVVDWQRDDLFHVNMDELARFLFSLFGRRVIFRNDYDLYEFTVYAYLEPLCLRSRGAFSRLEIDC